MILVYITNKDKSEAKKVAKHLLEKNLIACANIFPIESMYEWKGKLAEESEYVLIGKTSENKYKEVKKEVVKIHSYTVPCVMKIPVSFNKKYENWLKGELSEKTLDIVDQCL